MWKPEYEEARKRREAENPELRQKRLQSAKDSQERNRESRKVYLAEYYRANPDRYKRTTPEAKESRNAQRRKKYAEDHDWRAKHKAKVKDWQSSNPDKRQAQRLRKYGISLEEFNAMMERQNGRCAICRRQDQGFPMVDHCHATGKVRGLLCMQCNQGIGKLKDSEDLMRAAINYLSTHG